MVKFLEVSILLFAQGMNARPGYAYILLCKLEQLPSPLKASVFPSGTWTGLRVKQGTAPAAPPTPPHPPTTPTTLAGAASPEGFTGSRCGRLRLHPMVAARLPA